MNSESLCLNRQDRTIQNSTQTKSSCVVVETLGVGVGVGVRGVGGIVGCVERLLVATLMLTCKQKLSVTTS